MCFTALLFTLFVCFIYTLSGSCFFVIAGTIPKEISQLSQLTNLR